MKALFVTMILVSSSMAFASQLSQNCLQKAGKAALIAAIQDYGHGLPAAFRSIRLGAFADQGLNAEKGSPYQFENGNIMVKISTSMAMNPQDDQNQEVLNSEVFEVDVLNVKTCQLGKVSNITPE